MERQVNGKIDKWKDRQKDREKAKKIDGQLKRQIGS